MVSSSTINRTLSIVGYAFLILLTLVAALLTISTSLTQAAQTAPRHSWSSAVIVACAYAFILIVSLAFCFQRIISVRLKLHRISKSQRLIAKGDVPNSVHEYITEEYVRTCLIALQSEPKDVYHEGWGRPGTRYEGVRFRKALLDTIPEIGEKSLTTRIYPIPIPPLDALVHLVIPTHPTRKPHDRMLHHFRFIIPLLTTDEDELTPLHYYDSAIQLARNSYREPTEREFELGMEMADNIKRILSETRLEMLQGSSTQLNESD
ncbi:hypothetical protein V5O48_001710 [Marasmius crinis-equi]|uniref:Defect at low temperature protein 1 n=1 Tax=Marasmius crinis-equi TaxID=585013 RepID=A0ABR3FXP6_9AGAR